MTSFVPVSFHDPRAVRLLQDYEAEIAERYGNDEPSAAAADDFTGPVGVFLLGLLDDVPVACGGLRPHPDGGELKKVYVAPAARGTGTGRALVRALAAHARARGLSRLVLQTGTAQPEAMALYESEGWEPVPVYGEYADDPRCRCYGLRL